jgi:GntR family transcriptional regulator/MocR family aminotransferase
MSAARIAAVARCAAERGVVVQILSLFAMSKSPQAGIMLGYGAIPTARVEEGLCLLRACFDE